jgi:hypothetical protein
MVLGTDLLKTYSVINKIGEITPYEYLTLLRMVS